MKTETQKTTKPSALEIAIDALKSIAAYDDKGAQEHWKRTGKFSMFDEPSSVQEARTALRKIRQASK